jgi:hypothetical protein
MATVVEPSAILQAADFRNTRVLESAQAMDG